MLKQALMTITLQAVVGLTILGCGGPLRPSDENFATSHEGDSTGEASLSLQIDALDVHNILATASSLRVRVFPVVDGNLGAQEGGDQTFSLNAAADVKIRILTVGEKELQFAISR